MRITKICGVGVGTLLRICAILFDVPPQGTDCPEGAISSFTFTFNITQYSAMFCSKHSCSFRQTQHNNTHCSVTFKKILLPVLAQSCHHQIRQKYSKTNFEQYVVTLLGSNSHVRNQTTFAVLSP
jgi:hypothetical protein